MSIMDFYTMEQAVEALEQCKITKKEFIKQIETLNTMMFILEYHIATGESLDPEIFGIEPVEEDLDD